MTPEMMNGHIYDVSFIHELRGNDAYSLLLSPLSLLLSLKYPNYETPRSSMGNSFKLIHR